MLNQLELNLLQILYAYGPTILTMALQVVILIFAIFILKKNSYKYGIMLMLSSILSLVAGIVFIAINRPFLWYILNYEMGLPYSVADTIVMTLDFVFFGLNTTSLVFLLIAIIQIYKTHKRD